MALTYTPEAELGIPCPSFKLPATDGKTYSLEDFKDSPCLVVMFICNHCPYVQALEDRYIALNKELQAQKVQFVGICSNDPTEYQEDSFDELKKRWSDKGYNFPYLHDESQTTAKFFGAVCTPEFYVYNSERKLTYRGRFDDSWKNPAQVQNQELKQAILSTLNGAALPQAPIPSMGCSIKWKS